MSKAKMNYDIEDIHNYLLSKATPPFSEISSIIKRNGIIGLPSQRTKYSPLEYLQKIIIGQQLSTSVANVIWERVVNSGFNLNENSDRIALVKHGVSKSKAKAMNELVSKFPLMDEILKSGDEKLIRENLLSVWGIGKWTTEIFLIFYLNHQDILPAEDGSIQRALKDILSTNVNTTLVEDLSARFSPYGSYLSMHLWAFLDKE
jgi:DNA-3-methyladenine glycosylase II